MSISAIRQRYGVPAKRGGIVEYLGPVGPRRGIITGATKGLLRVRLDGWEEGYLELHPTRDVRYLDSGSSDAGASAKLVPLMPCPCGRTPSALHLSPDTSGKFATISPDCCRAWELEVRINHAAADGIEAQARARAQWNNAPRATPQSAEAPRQHWRPISEAPHDGTEVWAFNGEQARMKWVEGDGYALWIWADEVLCDIDPNPRQPTHFMGLPPDPLLKKHRRTTAEHS